MITIDQLSACAEIINSEAVKLGVGRHHMLTELPLTDASAARARMTRAMREIGVSFSCIGPMLGVSVDVASRYVSLPTSMNAVNTREFVRSYCAEHRISVDDIRGPSRSPTLVVARTEIVRALIAAGVSHSAIGRAINRDHSTIFYHARGRRRATDDRAPQS